MLTDITNVLRQQQQSTNYNEGVSIVEASQSTELVAKAEPSRCKVFLSRVLDHWMTTLVMTLLTIYALFGDDLRLAATEKSSDEIFYGLSTACLFLFSVEIVFGCVVKEGYLFSFFFWLDVVATISLIPDIGWIWEPLLTSITGSDNSSGNNATDASQIARAGRASRAGTRAGRIIRILRVIRLIRIVKLYKLSQEARLGTQKNGQNSNLKRAAVKYRGSEIPLEISIQSAGAPLMSFEEASISQSFDAGYEPVITVLNSDKTDNQQKQGKLPEEEVAVPEESKVGKRLGELTTKRVIMLVLGMMFGLPLFFASFYVDTNSSYQFGLEVIDLFVEPGYETEFDQAWDNYISEHRDLITPLIYLEVENKRIYESETSADDLRSVEQEPITLENADSDYFYTSLAIFDLRRYTQLEALLNMGRTVFICMLLSISSILFSNDAQNLILGPIESMIQKVKNIAKNPLRAAQEEEREEYTKQLILDEEGEGQTKEKQGEIMETHALEATLTKIGALLALGFGEAGSEIIAANMQRGGGDVDPMIPGKTVQCIFGFCDIRNFTDTTEILQQEVMRFVNEIAVVVHSTVDHFSGNANKNIGDAFLLTWKFPEECSSEENQRVLARDNPFVNVLADMSVISFLKIIAEIHTNPKIAKYRDHPLLTRAMPGYSVKMGFGLHQGWAIEGAIGSEYKIDASYLSPNVNMASRLEAATKQFGVPLLISEDLYKICSSSLREEMRMIDKVTVKGSSQPIELYTCDLETKHLPVKFARTDNEKPELKKARIMARIKRDQLKEDACSGNICISDFIEQDEDLKLMRANISNKFLAEFDKGLNEYLEGNWSLAVNTLVRAESIKGEEDGPARTLIEFMENEGRVPSDWPGYRELHEK